MGEKKKKSNNNEEGEKKPPTVVLNIDLHCKGCASKIIKSVRSIDGVEMVKAETDSNKLTVIGNVDPSKLREKLVKKTNKTVNLISPQPKKDNNNDKKDSKQDKNPEEKKTKEKEKEKEKEAPVTTAVLKVSLHCQGCIKKIRKSVNNTKGVLDMSLDKQKDLVTVKGTMDVKALVETLQEKLKRSVEVVPPKKEKDGGGENNGGGGKKKKGGGGDGGGQEGESGGGGGGGKVDKMEFVMQPGYPYGYVGGYPYPYAYPTVGVGYDYPLQMHAPQMFSDENPNACSIM